MRIIKILGILAVVALAVSACCSPCRKAAKMSKVSFAGIEWKLIQWDSEIMSGTGTNAYTVLFSDEGRISGFGDCNRFSGTYTYTQAHKTNKVSIGPLATTRMACPDMAKENRFLEALGRVERFGLDGDLLVLSSGATKLVFEKK